MKDVRALQVIPGELVKPVKSNFPSRLAQSRAELLEKLLTELGTENSGFTLNNVMTVKDLKHATYIYPFFFSNVEFLNYFKLFKVSDLEANLFFFLPQSSNLDSLTLKVSRVCKPIAAGVSAMFLFFII